MLGVGKSKGHRQAMLLVIALLLPSFFIVPGAVSPDRREIGPGSGTTHYGDPVDYIDLGVFSDGIDVEGNATVGLPVNVTVRVDSFSEAMANKVLIYDESEYTYSFPQYSPNGSFIAYRNNDYAGDGQVEVHRIDYDGSGHKRLTTYGAEYSPRWSGDGKLITYFSKQGTDPYYQVWVMDWDGGNKTRLTDGNISNQSCDISQDGRTIIYRVIRNGYKELRMKIWNGTEWTGDDDQYLFDIRNMAIFGQNDSVIVFDRNDTGSPYRNLWIAYMNGSWSNEPRFERLTNTSFNETALSVSPEGILSYRSLEGGNPQGDLWLLDMRTGDRVRMTNATNLGDKNTYPGGGFSSDGERYVSILDDDNDNKTEIWQLNVTAKAEVHLYEGDPSEGGIFIGNENVAAWGSLSTYAEFQWTPYFPGERKLYAELMNVTPVDGNASNNVATLTVNVSIGPYPDLGIAEDGITTSDQPQTGKPITVQVDVDNIGNVSRTSHILLDESDFNYSDPQYSPDGRYIAYRWYNSSGDGQFEIVRITADGKNETHLTSEGSDYMPRWSGDSKLICYYSKKDTFPLYGGRVMEPDGSNNTLVTEHGSYHAPARDLSSDGRSMLYTVNSAADAELWIKTRPGNDWGSASDTYLYDVRGLTIFGQTDNVIYAPVRADNETDWNIWRLTPNGSWSEGVEAERLTTSTYNHTPTSTTNTGLLAYHSREGGPKGDAWFLDTYTGETVKITNALNLTNGVVLPRGGFSSDGSKFIVSLDEDGDDNTELWELNATVTAKLSLYEGDPEKGGRLLGSKNLAAWEDLTSHLAISWVPDTPGNHSLYAVIEDQSRYDPNPYNDIAVLEVQVRGPHIVVDGGSFSITENATVNMTSTAWINVENVYGTSIKWNGSLNIYDGDPELGGFRIGVEDVSFDGIASDSLSFEWVPESPGDHDLFFNLTGVYTELMNMSAENVSVSTHVRGIPDLAVFNESITVLNPVVGLPAEVTINISNLDRWDIGANGTVRTYEGHWTHGVLIDTEKLTIDGNSTFVHTFNWTPTNDGIVNLHTRIVGQDPYDVNTSNDFTSREIYVYGRPDMSVTEDNVTYDERAIVNQTTQISVDVNNLDDHPDSSNVTVKIYQWDPDVNGTLIGRRTISLIGGGNELLVFNWTPSMVGDVTVYVVLDQISPLDWNISNHQITFDVRIVSAPDVAIDLDKVTIDYDVWDYDNITLTVPVRNLDIWNHSISGRLTVHDGDPTTDGGLIGASNFSVLGGSSERFTFNWSTYEFGPHRLFFNITGVEPDDVDWTNNNVSKWFTISSPKWPDLGINGTDIKLNDKAYLNSTITIQVEVHNFGEGNATNAAVSFYMDEIEEMKRFHTALVTISGKGSAFVNASWTAGPRGNRTIFVVVDMDDEIMELDENNNNASRVLQVQVISLFVSGSDIRFNGTLRAKENVTVLVSVHNDGDTDTMAQIVLYDIATGKAIGKREVDVYADSNDTVSFIWMPMDDGNYTLRAEATSLGGLDHDTSDNAATRTAAIVPRTRKGDDKEPVISAIGIISIGILGALGAVLATENGRWTIFLLFIPLYTREKTAKHPLKHPKRKDLWDHIRLNPGCTLKELQVRYELPNGTSIYHLNILEDNGFVNSLRDGTHRRFYPHVSKLPPSEASRIYPEGTPTYNVGGVQLSRLQFRVYEIVKDNHGISQVEVAEKLGVSRQVVSYHLGLLQDGEIIKVRKYGRRNAYYVNGFYGREK